MNRHSAFLGIVATAALLCGAQSFAATKPSINEAPFGTMPDGTPVQSYTLDNGKGMSAKVLTYGAIINELNVPDAKGAVTNVVLSVKTLEEYLGGFRGVAAIVGRVANRIADARFTLDGVEYKLIANNGTNHLHGLFGKSVWQARPLPTTRHAAALELSYLSKAGESGFPGNLTAKVVYTLTDANELRLDFSATTDQATPVNLASHAYFNLSGGGNVLDHVLWLGASRYTPVDDGMIPTGEIASVKGTAFDFTRPTRIGARIDQLKPRPGGYDHNFVLEGRRTSLKRAARVEDPNSGRSLEVRTTEPGVQFFTANHLNHAAFCLETQHFPDSVHHANFPSTILRPGETFRSITVFRFKAGAVSAQADDPNLWLEEVTGERALTWVRAQNAISTKELEASPDFEPIRKRQLSILDSKERIPHVSKHGAWCYNFWRDENNVRGLWRRTTLEEFKKPQPAWETVLDLDKLASAENENWVWKGYQVLYPSYDRCLLSLSRGGADATVIREFDPKTKQFVTNGFCLKEAKSRVDWRNRDVLYVGTDFGPGSLTASGYPRVVKEWRRGTSLDQAKLVFEGKPEDVSVEAEVAHDHGRTYELITRRVTFFTSEVFLRRGDQWVKISKPADATVDTFEDDLLLRLRSDWTVNGKTYPSGTLLAAPLDGYLKGEPEFQALFSPADRKSLAGWSATKRYLLLNELDNVRNRLYVLERKSGQWTRTPLQTPAFGTIGMSGIDPDESDDYFMTVTDFLTPSSLYFGTVGGKDRERLKTLPSFFNADGLEISQHEAVSKDGTRVPYFQVSRKGLALNGKNPTLLYGYGGFEIPMLPAYSAGVGAAWLERGCVYVLANIRGGGEFGPKWHEAARKQNRQRAYDDFIAVAEDLIARKVTSPKHLGIQGGSNGGLLVGVMLTQRPDLFKAVVCQVPLLDMRRFNKLLAGASWMDEYGNPDRPDEWAYISKYSPYQNVSKGRKYCRVLFTTSTRDDRVHPGHARKMVARMKEQGHDVLYYENIEGGHGGAANNKQSAYMSTLAYTFLLKELGAR